MANWNQQKTSAQYNPGFSQPYAPTNAFPPPQVGAEEKSPYEGGRFTPKKRVKDPIFLALFIAQVCKYAGFVGLFGLIYVGHLACRILRGFWPLHF